MKKQQPSAKPTPIAARIATPAPVARFEQPVSAVVVSTPSTARVIVLTRGTEPRKGSGVVYSLAGLRATVRFARSAFGPGEPPATCQVSGEGFAEPFVAKASMTKEERKAARAAMTPAMKAEKARAFANRASARAAKLEAAASA